MAHMNHALRRRLFEQGAATLTTVDLLGLLLDKPDAAEALLDRCGGLHGLAHAHPSDLHSLTEADSIKVLAVIELSKRLVGYNPVERPLVNNASAAAHLVADMRHLDQEHVRVILLDLNRRVIAIPTLYIGTLNASVLRISEIFREAIVRNSPAMILVHNHPAGDPSPSPEDVELTHSLIAAGKLLDIILVDHLIIGQHGWASMKDLGIAF